MPRPLRTAGSIPRLVILAIAFALVVLAGTVAVLRRPAVNARQTQGDAAQAQIRLELGQYESAKAQGDAWKAHGHALAIANLYALADDAENHRKWSAIAGEELRRARRPASP